MDHKAVTDLVEDYWRTLIPAIQTGGVSAFNDVSQRFEARIQQVAGLMEPIEAAWFLQRVEAERELLMAEYTSDPIAPERRLGVPLGADATKSVHVGVSSDLSGLVVRSAVRATI